VEDAESGDDWGLPMGGTESWKRKIGRKSTIAQGSRIAFKKEDEDENNDCQVANT
jgi:hypothetical protein